MVPHTPQGSYQLFSGHAVVVASERILLVSNLLNGIDAYTLPPTRAIKVFQQHIRYNVPLLVTSAKDGELVVVGSDDGLVRIYDYRSGTVLQELHHGPSKAPID